MLADSDVQTKPNHGHTPAQPGPTLTPAGDDGKPTGALSNPPRRLVHRCGAGSCLAQNPYLTQLVWASSVGWMAPRYGSVSLRRSNLIHSPDEGGQARKRHWYSCVTLWQGSS
jgi:hypothetical protein